MSDVVLMGLINLGLIGYIFYLRHKHHYTILMMHGIFEGIYHGKAEIVKLNEVYVPKAVQK